MSRRSLPLVLFAAILTASAGAQTSGAPEKHITATIDAAKTGAPISPYLYGQFIEHIGDLVNRSVWAEMLDDRKFYHPSLRNPPPPSRHRKARCEAAGPTVGARRPRLRRW